jgi:hypothetical protein
MNKRIKEILEDSTEVYNFWNTGEAKAMVDHKVFADILIIECANVIQDFVDHRFPASEYPERLKRYFGVK